MKATALYLERCKVPVSCAGLQTWRHWKEISERTPHEIAILHFYRIAPPLLDKLPGNC